MSLYHDLIIQGIYGYYILLSINENQILYTATLVGIEKGQKRVSKKYLERRVKCILIFPNLEYNSQKKYYQLWQHAAEIAI